MLKPSVVGSTTFEPHEDAAPKSRYYGISGRKRRDRHYRGHNPQVVAESAAHARRICGDDKDPPGIPPISEYDEREKRFDTAQKGTPTNEYRQQWLFAEAAE